MRNSRIGQKEEARPGTVSIPDAARILGVSRNTAYAAATRGEIPTITIGRRKVVPKAALDRLLGSR